MKFGVTLESKNPLAVADENLAIIQSLGFDCIRAQLHWDKMQPTQGSAIDFTESDRQIALCAKYNLKFVWALQQTPDWALQSGASSVADPTMMAAYALACYQRYGSSVFAWQCGNEEWSWEQNAALKTPQNYLSVFNAVYAALTGAGFVGNLGSFGYTNYHNTADITAWFTGFLAGNPHTTDLGFHFYHEGQDPLTTLTGKPSITDVITAIRAAGNAFLPLNCSEFGYVTHCDAQHPSPCNEVTPALQATHEQSILTALYNDNNNNHAFVYTLCPPPEVMSIYQSPTQLNACAMFKAFIPAH